MTKREVVQLAIQGRKPPYVPWNFGFTYEAREKLVAHFGTRDLDQHLEPHIGGVSTWTSENIGHDCFRDKRRRDGPQRRTRISASSRGVCSPSRPCAASNCRTLSSTRFSRIFAARLAPRSATSF